MFGETKPPAALDGIHSKDTESGNAQQALGTEEPEARTAEEISFDPFKLFPTRRLLLEGDRPVRIGSRALDVLIALVERQGQLVSKRALVAKVWPHTFVDEGNLKVHIAALRRSLGDGQSGKRYISTIAGRGYCFVAPVIRSAAPQPAPAGHSMAQSLTKVPKPLAGPAGIDVVVARISELLAGHHSVALAGPGGTGKTSAAIATAGRLTDHYDHGIWLVDLAAINDPRFLTEMVDSAIRLGNYEKRSRAELLTHFRDKRILILLDSCEHVIDDVATLVIQMIQTAPGAYTLDHLGKAIDHVDDIVECVLELVASRHIGLAKSRKIPCDDVK